MDQFAYVLMKLEIALADPATQLGIGFLVAALTYANFGTIGHRAVSVVLLSGTFVAALVVLRVQPAPIVFGYSVVLASWLVMLGYRIAFVAPPPSSVPDVVLLPGPGQLQLHNREPVPLRIWGTRLAGGKAVVEAASRIIPKDGFYYFPTADLEREIKKVGINGETLTPFETYLEGAGSQQFIAKFLLRIAVSDGRVSFHTQQLGVERGSW
ncbi:MAG: hypothetical protein JSR78_06255 [Proteobacteria bacterium]|nr:hypothetical protein [Pseudomonadota bacterium]